MYPLTPITLLNHMNNVSKPVVIKLGGSIFDAQDATLIDLVRLQNEGYKLIVVHGGAKMITAWCTGLGIESSFHQGERVTDRKSLEVVTAILSGLANKETVAAITRAGGRAVGLSGVDGSLLRARIKDVALGYIGEIEHVDPQPLTTLLDAGYMPIVSPVSYHGNASDDTPLLLNVNGDTAAGAIAKAIDAAQLIYLTDIDGIRGSSGKVINDLGPDEAEELITTGVASGGMIPKLKSCLVAIEAGITCRIVDGRRPRALIDAVSGTAAGTTFHPRHSH